jgi:hypothetical protein
MPVRALSSPNVVALHPANRSDASASRKECERSPFRTAAAIPSKGTPARSKPCTQLCAVALGSGMPGRSRGPSTKPIGPWRIALADGREGLG